MSKSTVFFCIDENTIHFYMQIHMFFYTYNLFCVNFAQKNYDFSCAKTHTIHVRHPLTNKRLMWFHKYQIYSTD